MRRLAKIGNPATRRHRVKGFSATAASLQEDNVSKAREAGEMGTEEQRMYMERVRGGTG